MKAELREKEAANEIDPESVRADTCRIIQDVPIIHIILLYISSEFFVFVRVRASGDSFNLVPILKLNSSYKRRESDSDIHGMWL
jgi:hypothetical protein